MGFNCTVTTFLNTSEFLSSFLHVFGCFSIPMHIFGGYCILHKTPPSMSSVKWCLLNFHFWTCFLDLVLSVLVTPYLFLPILGGYSLGILNKTGLRLSEETYLTLTIIAIMSVSGTMIFENRFNILFPRTNIWRHIRIPWITIDYIIAIITFIPMYLKIPDQQFARNLYMNSVICIPNYIDFDKLFFLSLDYYYQTLTCVFLAIFNFSQILSFAVLTSRTLKNQINVNSSSNTVKMQKSFQKALIAQVSLPAFIIGIPIVYTGISIAYQFHYQFLNNFSVILLSSHGFFSTIAMLAIHRPYREYTQIPIHIFGGYCILYKTPPNMSSVKWCLLNFHCWSCFLDLGLSLLTTPYLFLPALAGSTVGLLNLTGLGVGEQAFLMMATVGIVIVSVIVIFEKRLFILLSNQSYWRHFRIPWLIVDFLIALLYFLPTYFSYPDQDYARKVVIKNFGCIPKYINIDSVFFISTLDNTFLGTYTSMVQFFFAQIFIFAILTDRILKKQMKMTNISKQTVRLQRLFQKALILQVALPFIVLFIPLVCAGFSALWWLHYQYLTNILVILFSSHGFFSTITMISVHRPYREYTRNLIRYTILVRQDRGIPMSNVNSIT